MSIRQPSKKSLRQEIPKSKGQPIGKDRVPCECEERELSHSRRLCSTNHNARSLAQLHPSATAPHVGIHTLSKQSEKGYAERKRHASRGKKSVDMGSRKSDKEPKGEEGGYEARHRANKAEQEHLRSQRPKPHEQYQRSDSEYVCRCCRESDKQQLYLKYKTEMLKTSFLKEQVEKLKQRLSKAKVDSQEPINSLAYSSAQEVVCSFPIFRLAPKERNRVVQAELSRLKAMFATGVNPQRIYHTLCTVLSQLKDHMEELEEAETTDGREKAKVSRELKQCLETLKKAQEQSKQTKSKLKKAMRENVELSEQAEDQIQELKMLRAMVENERDHAKSTDTNFDKLHREFSKLEAENALLQQKHREIKHSNERLVELRGQLEREFERNLQELELANEEINFLKIENEKLKARKGQLELACDRLQSEIKELRLQASVEKDRLVKSKQKLELQFASKSLELAEAERLQQRMLGLIHDNDELRSQLDLKDKQLTETSRKLQRCEGELVSKEQEAMELARQNSALLADVTSCKKEIQALHIDIAELKRTTENYKNRQLMKSKKSIFEEEGREARQEAAMGDRDKQGKLKALADIQSLIRRHRQQLD